MRIYIVFNGALSSGETGNNNPRGLTRVEMKTRERILLVDDEPQITHMVKRLLERSGFQVDDETNSMKALARFQCHPDDYDLVITDMKMPKMNGVMLSKAMLSIRPDVPIILCTGFSADVDSGIAKELGIRAFMIKPVSWQKLTDTIRSILDA